MQPQESTAQIKTLLFPSSGIDVSTAFMRQQPRQITGNTTIVQQNPQTGQPIVGGYDMQGMQVDPHMWAPSTPSGINVRGYDPQQNRRRGGSRNGLTQYVPGQVNGVPWVVQCLAEVVDVEVAAQ